MQGSEEASGRGRELVESIRPELLRHFKPAFLGRLVVVPYYPLGDDEIGKIVKLKLAKIEQRFKENHRAVLTYDEALVQAIVDRCTEVDTGARNIDHILTHTSLLPEVSRRGTGAHGRRRGIPWRSRLDRFKFGRSFHYEFR